MNKQQLRNERPDHKTVNTYLADTDGQVYWLFGATDEVILCRQVYFEGNEIHHNVLESLPYDRFQCWVSVSQLTPTDCGASFIISPDEMLASVESVESVESSTIKTVSRTILVQDVARIRALCRIAGIRLAIECGEETADCIVLRQDANKFVHLLVEDLFTNCDTVETLQRTYFANHHQYESAILRSVYLSRLNELSR
jgi:hypothetical protein